MKVLYVLPPDVPKLERDESRLYVFKVAALLSRQGVEVFMLLPADMKVPEMPGLRTYRWSHSSRADVLRPVLRETRPAVVQVENCPWLVPEVRQAFPGRVLLNLHSLEPLSGDAISRRALRLSLCLVDQVVLSSFFLKNLFIGRYYGLRLRVTVVYPGVDGSVFRPADTDRFLLRERQKQRLLWAVKPDETLALLATSPGDKGRELLLQCRATAALSRLKLLVVGNAPLLSPAEVTAVDALSPENYRAADLFLYPAQERAADGRFCLPAMATSLPIVAGLRGSVPEFAGPQAGHYIRQFADASAWATGLSAVVASASLRQTMAQAGLLRSRAFTWERTARDFLQLYSRGHLSLG